MSERTDAEARLHCFAEQITEQIERAAARIEAALAPAAPAPPVGIEANQEAVLNLLHSIEEHISGRWIPPAHEPAERALRAVRELRKRLAEFGVLPWVGSEAVSRRLAVRRELEVPRPITAAELKYAQGLAHEIEAAIVGERMPCLPDVDTLCQFVLAWDASLGTLPAEDTTKP